MAKICKKCKGEIEEHENHCTLTSYSNSKISNEDSWHSICWKEDWEEKMDKKVKEYAMKLKNQALPMVMAKFGGM